MEPLRLISLASMLSGIFAAGSFSCIAQTAQPNRTPVLVELFTAEGCSSCPPADALLAMLDHEQPISNAEIIVLGEHVDYWDNQGWRDRFSSHQYTDRQSQYSFHMHLENGVYTPQMIVDGTDQFVGNDASHAQRAIQHAAQSPKLDLVLSQPVVDGRKVSASVTMNAPPANRPQADLYAALVDPTDTTDVRGGENSGHKLQHVGVVRTLQKVGNLKELASGAVAIKLNAPSDANPAAMRMVVFAQQSGQGAVLGAVSSKVAP